MAAVPYNVFVPGMHAGQININKIKQASGATLTTERSVGGVMYYGVMANNTQEALRNVQAAIGTNYTENPSVFLQSNDTRQGN
jgi:hypothetical protein